MRCGVTEWQRRYVKAKALERARRKRQAEAMGLVMGEGHAAPAVMTLRLEDETEVVHVAGTVITVEGDSPPVAICVDGNQKGGFRAVFFKAREILQVRAAARRLAGK